MNANDTQLATRVGAWTALSGSACAVAGAALGIASGADIDASLTRQDMAGYLTTAGDHQAMLVANLVLWIAMVILMPIAATAMTALSPKRPFLAQLARFWYWTGSPLVIAAFVAWLAIVIQLAPDTSPDAVMVANTLGWFASRADWIATVFFVGIGPTFLSMAGREDWVPSWLYQWGWLTALAGGLTTVAMLTGGSGLTTYGFAIVPVGVGWMVAAGIVLIRRR